MGFRKFKESFRSRVSRSSDDSQAPPTSPGKGPLQYNTTTTTEASNKASTRANAVPDRTLEIGTPPANLHGPLASAQSSADTQPAAQAQPARQPGLDVDTPIHQLWNLAYERLREEDEELITNYEAKLVGNLAAGLAAGPGAALCPRLSTRHHMETILRRKMDEVNRDAWKLKFGSTSEVQVKDLVQPVLDVVAWANKFITGALSTNPSASMAWAGVSLILPLFLHPSEQAASLAKGLEYISSLIVHGRMREDLYFRRYESKTDKQELSHPFHTAYEDTLEMLYRQILKFQAKSYCYYTNNAAFRLGLDVIKWNEWDTLLEDIKKQEAVFVRVSETWRDMKYDDECLAVEKRHQETLYHWEAIGSQVSGLREAVEDNEAETKRIKLLDWLCEIDPSTIYNSASDKRESGTGDWLVEESNEFETWKNASASLLWLHGKAGSGKSVLSSWVIKHLRDGVAASPDTALAYFFFSFSDLEKQNVVGMLSSLVKQLYASCPDTPPAIKSLGEYKKKGEHPDTKTLERVLIATARGFSSVFLIIDALDECPTLNKERKMLLDSLSRIVAAMPNNVHLFCTSRAEPDIAAAMDNLLSPPSRAAIDLTGGQRRKNLNHDIGLYIDSTFASADYDSWPAEVKAKARASLIEKADGMYVLKEEPACNWLLTTALGSSMSFASLKSLGISPPLRSWKRRFRPSPRDSMRRTTGCSRP
jgi:hypothetical protein